MNTTNDYQAREELIQAGKELLNQLNTLYPEPLPTIIQNINPPYKGKKILDVEKQWDILKSALLKSKEERKVYGITEENVIEVLYRRLKKYLGVRPKLEEKRNSKEINIKENLDPKYWTFYLPLFELIVKNVEEKKKHNSDQAFILGMSGGQGTGKSTKAEFLKVLLEDEGYKVVAFSSDDIYLPHEGLMALKQSKPNIYFYTSPRGPHGTHEVSRFVEILDNIRYKKGTKVTKFDKKAFGGIGDRKPEKDWLVVPKDTDIAIVDGSVVGTSPISEEELCKPTSDRILTKIEQKYDPQCIIRKEFNKAAKDYVNISNRIDYLIYLDVGLDIIRKGRMEQERKLIEATGQGMDFDKLSGFIDYYSLFYRIMENLKKSERTNLVVTIEDNQEVKEVIAKKPILIF